MDMARRPGALENLIAHQGENRPETRGTPVPKSWFTQPNEMLSDLGFGYMEHPSSITYDTLRSMSLRNSVIAAVHQTRIGQITQFCKPQENEFSVGFVWKHRNRFHKMTSADEDRKRELTSYILNCGVKFSYDRDDFETFAKKTIRDRLTYDQMTWEKIPTFSGLPHSFHAVDAATIRLVKRPHIRSAPMSNEEERTRIRYRQIDDGVIIAEYTAEEMNFAVSNPRSDIRVKGYGLSELELLITTVTYHLFAEQWNQNVFSQGATTKGIVNVSGNVSPAAFEDFKIQWLSQIAGVQNAWRTPITNMEDVSWIPLQPSNTDMGYQQWLEYLIKIVAAIYQINPAQFNFDVAGPQNAPSHMTVNEARQEVSKDRGLAPMVETFFKEVNRDLIAPHDPNWVLTPVGLDARTEEQAIELRQKALQSHRTMNEIRAEEGLPPVLHGDVVMNPVYTSHLTQVQGRQQQEEAMRQQQQMATPNEGEEAPQQLPEGPLGPSDGNGQPQQEQTGTPGMQEQAQLVQQDDQKFERVNSEIESVSAEAGEAIERLARNTVSKGKNDLAVRYHQLNGIQKSEVEAIPGIKRGF